MHGDAARKMSWQPRGGLLAAVVFVSPYATEVARCDSSPRCGEQSGAGARIDTRGGGQMCAALPAVLVALIRFFNNDAVSDDARRGYRAAGEQR